MARKSTAVLDYARHLLSLHALEVQGKNDSPEADAIRDEMDDPWYAMTPQEQERVGGLSEDLYALAKGGPPRIAMTESEIQAWKRELLERRQRFEQGDIDGWLEFLRKPRPNDVPPPTGISRADIQFLQAQAWERLGDFHVAVTFMKAAEEDDPTLAALVVRMLSLAGDRDGVKKYANRILGDAQSPPLSVYLAASFLLGTAERIKMQKEMLGQRLIPVLKRALEKEQKTRPADREFNRTELNLMDLIGACYEMMGKDRDALSAYDEALKRFPQYPNLWVRRGVVLIYLKNDDAGYEDLEKAVSLGTNLCTPFLLLAQRAFRGGSYLDSYRLAKTASESLGANELRSLAHQIIAMSLSMRNQDIDWVLDNFKLAERLDPENLSVAANRAVAVARADKKETVGLWNVEKPDQLDFGATPPQQVDEQVSRFTARALSVA
jgi:tetratricopeptide (TPR) repeat protein